MSFKGPHNFMVMALAIKQVAFKFLFSYVDCRWLLGMVIWPLYLSLIVNHWMIDMFGVVVG